MIRYLLLPLVGFLLLGGCASGSGSSDGRGSLAAPPGAFTYPPGLEPRRGAGSR